MKRYLLIGCIFLLVISGSVHAVYAVDSGGIENLAGKVTGDILHFFSGKHNVRAAVVKFQNFSDLSDLAAQKYYQLLVSGLETGAQLEYTDLMINFHKGKGEFNLNRADKLNYLIYIKLIRHRDKLGAGIAIFSRSLDKIVHIKYLEELVSVADKDIYETRDYGFKGSGFSSRIQIEVEKNLLDFKSLIDADGTGRYFFFYPEKIDIFKIEGNRFTKFSSIALEWGSPYYPVMEHEGRLTLFTPAGGDRLYLTVGSNFSSRSKIFHFEEGQWLETGTVDFVPLRMIRLNDNDYLAGARYDDGKNYFDGGLVLVPFGDGRLRRGDLLEKQVPSFYALDFLTPEGEGNSVEAVHMVDTAYNYRFFAGDFEERTAMPEKRGASLAALNGLWLAVSSYSYTGDTLYFYKTEAGGNRLVYENKINGQVVFISNGAWKTLRGFWVYIKKRERNRDEYTMQFWSENNG